MWNQSSQQLHLNGRCVRVIRVLHEGQVHVMGPGSVSMSPASRNERDWQAEETTDGLGEKMF